MQNISENIFAPFSDKSKIKEKNPQEEIEFLKKQLFWAQQKYDDFFSSSSIGYFIINKKYEIVRN